MFRVRLKTTWQTGHLVFPLCTSLCLYREPWFKNFLPQILHWCPSMRGTMFTPAMPCQSPASPTHRHSTNKKEIKINCCNFSLQQSMFCYHVALHVVNAAKENLADRAACLPFVYIIVLVKRPHVCKSLPASLASMSIFMLNTSLPFPRIPHQ